MKRAHKAGEFRSHPCPGCGTAVLHGELCSDCLEREAEARRGGDE